MDAPWRIVMLGALRVEANGQVVAARFRTRHVGALLARLALFPRRAHGRDELADLLWPDADMEAGRNRLRVALASLRRQLEPPGVPGGGILIADRSCVRLNPDAVRCDVVEFETALAQAAHAPSPETAHLARERALALYGGDLLPGFYDDWIVDERARLCALYEELCHYLSGEHFVSTVFSAPLVSDNHSFAAPDAAPDLRGVPLSLSRFFGREEEYVQLSALLADQETRLVTLTGPGGVGKTRMAAEASRRAAFNGPIVWASLADLQDAALIPATVAQALGLTLTILAEPLDLAAEALAAGPPALLVLDNMEHLVERGASLVQSLLTRVPTLTCLATSRRRLALPGEQEMPLPPLALPSPKGTAEEVAESASARLFVDRARAARPDFGVTPRNAADLAELCQELEGLPLALELAAARAGTMSVAEMRGRLAQRFAWLASKHADKQSRHRSLWAALSWSVDLLPPPLARFFAGLSVFRGGCGINAAEAVCEEAQALEMLTQLRERSLVQVEEGPHGMRFRLLESVREFAEAQHVPEAQQALGARHAAYFEGVAAEAAAVQFGPERERLLQVLDTDADNLRAALKFCREAADGEQSLRLATSLSDYWKTRGLLQEGLGWLDDALARAGEAVPTGLRMRALAEAGWLAAALGHHNRAEADLTEAIERARQLGDDAAVADTLRRRGTLAIWRGRTAQAAADLEEVLAVSHASGDAFVQAQALLTLGVLSEADDKERAQALYEESLALFQQCGDRQRAAYCLHNLGNIASEHDGDHARGEALLSESLAIAEAMGDHWQRAYCLRSLGDIALERGDAPGATRTLEAGRALCLQLGDRMSEAGTVCSLGRVARQEGDWARARAHYEAAQGLYAALGQAEGEVICQVNLAEIAATQGQWTRAAGLLALASQDPEMLAGSAVQPRHEAARQEALAALGPDAFDTAWARALRVSKS